MPHWDAFHSDRLEAERSLTTEAVRAMLARGDLVEDDLIRPAGDTRWVRIGDSPEFADLASPDSPDPGSPPPVPPGEFAPPSFEDLGDDDPAASDPERFEDDPHSRGSLDRDALARVEREPGPEFAPPRSSDFEVIVEEDDAVDDEYEVGPRPRARPNREGSDVADSPILPDEETEAPDLPELDDEGPDLDFEEFDPQDEDEEAAEFTLSRNSAERVEELDLAAMVDVAFQLVLFFLVTAQVVLFKTLEVPRPNEDKPPEAAAQARAKSLDDLSKDYILVEVDAAGAIKVDRQPVAANRSALVERLRTSRETTARKGMLLSADFATRHENAVLVFDVANEIDLRIAIAQPTAKK